MSVFGLLNTPFVLLLDNSNYQGAKEILRHLTGLPLGGSIYVFAHYINSYTRENLQAAFPSLIWKEAGEAIIYEQLCADGKMLPTRVTFYLLPDLLPEPQIIILWKLIDKQSFVKMTKQITWWKQTHVPFVETKDFSYLDLDLLRKNRAFNQFVERE